MGVVKQVLLNFNSFQSPQFFRFNGEPQFTNYLGGIFTILIRGILLALIIYKLISVFGYSTVYATTTIKYSIDPALKTVVGPSKPDNLFLVAVQAVVERSNRNMTAIGADLVSWTRNATGSTTLLQPCTREHWAQAPDSIWNELQANVNMTKSFLYCFPRNYEHVMDISQESLLQVDFALRCRNDCMTINFTALFIRPIIYNRLVNPQQNDKYITKFLDKRRYYGITNRDTAFDTVLDYYISRYNVKTDESLMPWEDSRTEGGIFIPEQPGLSYHPNLWNTYVFFRMTFLFSNKEFNYFRHFQKIFDAISLVGGLIPIFMITFIWLYYYALAHFEMTFVKKLHSDQKAKEYGIGYFFSKLMYTVLTACKVDMKNWKQTQEYHKMHKIVNNHLLDVIYLYKRLQYVERALEVLLQEHQKKVLHLMRNKTFHEAESNYQLYQMKGNLAKFINKRKKIKKQREQKLYKNEIILEPKEPHYNTMGESLNTDKNLVQSKQFQGDVKEESWPPRSSEILRNQESKSSSDGQERPEDRQIQESEQDSEYNEEMENEELDALRDAYESYEKLKREAEDAGSEYYSVISRNIFHKLDYVDKQLLQELDNLLHISDREEILMKVMTALENKEDVALEQSIFKRKNSIKKSSSVDHPLMKSSSGLAKRAQMIERSKRQSQSKKSKRPVQQRDQEGDEE